MGEGRAHFRVAGHHRSGRHGAVRRSGESRFRKAFENAPIGVALIEIVDGDLDGFLSVNKAMSGLTGYSETELADSSLDELTMPEDRYLDSAQRRRLLSGKLDSFTIEKRFLHHEGHEVWAQFSLSWPRERERGPVRILQMKDSASAAASSSAPLPRRTRRAHRARQPRRFRGELEQQIDFYARYGGQGAILIIDVDNFKEVNDPTAPGWRQRDPQIAELLLARARVSTRWRALRRRVRGPASADRSRGALRFAEDLRRAVGEQTTAAARLGHGELGVRCSEARPSRGASRPWWPPTWRCTRPRTGRDRVVLVEEPRARRPRRPPEHPQHLARSRRPGPRPAGPLQQPIINLKSGKAERTSCCADRRRGRRDDARRPLHPDGGAIRDGAGA